MASRGIPIADFDSILSGLEDAEGQIQAAVDATPDMIIVAINEARPNIARLVHKMLASNYRRTGLGSKTKGRESTGKLLKAIENAIVTIDVKKKGDQITAPKIRLAMPKNVGDYKGQKGSSSFYAAAGALNYGSVYAPKTSGLSHRQKNKIKRLAVSNRRTATQLFGGVAIRGSDIRDEEKSIRIDGRGEDNKRVGIHVIQADKYFHLTPAQLKNVSDILTKDIQDKLGI